MGADTVLARIPLDTQTPKADQCVAQRGRDGQRGGVDTGQRLHRVEHLSNNRFGPMAIVPGGTRIQLELHEAIGAEPRVGVTHVSIRWQPVRCTARSTN